MLRLFCLALMLAYVSAKTPYTTCDGVSDVIDSLNVGDCKVSPCVFKKGTSVPVTAKFTLKSNTNTLNTDVVYTSGSFSSTPVPFNICSFLAAPTGAMCPIQANTQYSVKFNVDVLSSIPTSTGTITARSRVDGNGVISCVKVNVKVID